ncbi:MAG TPA: hypothetical protein VHO90_18765, partial [Bacteroidales bacterium]|nr:hypothetical protein [Bacteroidales bacterium]
IPCSIGLRAFNYETKEFISILDYEAIDILLGEKKENHSEFDKQIISALHNRNDSENPILVLFKLKDF